MNSVGVIRTIDKSGRITIVMELRRNLGIREHDKIEILQRGEEIILRKWGERCIICNTEISDNKNNKVKVKDKTICSKCMSKLQNK